MQLLLRDELVEAAAWRNLKRDGSKDARKALFDRFVPFARQIARSEWHRLNAPSLDRTDAEQLAHEALLVSIDRFDPGRGVPFTAYARLLPAGEVRFWDHYPENDARDERTRSRWYYPAHATGERDPDEHGHLHLFLHRTQLHDPAAYSVAPATGENAPAHVTHIALVDRSGRHPARMVCDQPLGDRRIPLPSFCDGRSSGSLRRRPD